jgi:hypothetical protein
MDKSLIARLEYIKNVDRQDITDDKVWDWAYKSYQVGEEFQLQFHSENGEERIKNHVLKLPKGALIILSQKPLNKDRYLTHVVELVNEGFKDQPQWRGEDTWGIFRLVKVHWIADFNNLSKIPLDKDVMQVNWGYQNTLAKSLIGKKLKERWNDIETLREHLQRVFCLN